MERGTNLIREQNLKTVRRLMNRRVRATKAELSRESGLSVVALQSLLQAMEERGEIRREGMFQPDHGRPAAVYRYEERAQMVLSICMYEKQGEDTAVFSACDLLGNVVETREIPLVEPEADSFDGEIASFLEAYPSIAAVGFGIPGEAVDGRLVTSDYERLTGADICGHVQRNFGRQAFVQNDVNAAIAGYCARRQTPEDQVAVGIYVPKKYGPGMGVWIHGRLWCGRDGMVGEVEGLLPEVNWRQPGEAASRRNALARLAKVCILMYNPHRLVIYGDVEQGGMKEMIREALGEPLGRIMMPQMEFCADLRPDFEAGILSMGLERVRGY